LNSELKAPIHYSRRDTQHSKLLKETIMGTTTKSLRALLNHIDEGELVLPEIQREFVWTKNNVLQLFDSLYRGFPIGFMLVWKAKVTVAHKSIGKKYKVKVGHSINNFYGYLLDGQQRLTAMQFVRDSDDKYPLVFGLRAKDEDNPDDNRFSYRARWNDNPWYLSVADVLNNEVDPLNVLEQLKEDEDFDYYRDGEKVLASFTRLQAILNYQVGIIEFGGDDYREATELFIRFNSTGKKLSRSDLASAELALSVPKLVTEGINRTSTKFSPYFNFTRPFLIQCLAAVHTGRMNLANPRAIWKDKDEKQIKRSWGKTERGLGRTIELLSGIVKWDSDNWIPSINSIIPLVFLLSQSTFDRNERVQAKKWLIKANFHAVFSGSVHTELDRILRGLKSDNSMMKLWNLTKRGFNKIKPEDFETGRKSGGTMSLFISMLRDNNAKDWVSQTSLNGKVIGHNAELQVHHFFPKALLRKHGYSSNSINTFANYTIINKETNLKISAEEPIDYLKRLEIKKGYLEKQCIPLNKNLWVIERYGEFISERRKLLANQANMFLKI